MTPAQLTRASTGPSSSSARDTSLPTWVRSVTSVGTTMLRAALCRSSPRSPPPPGPARNARSRRASTLTGERRGRLGQVLLREVPGVPLEERAVDNGSLEAAALQGPPRVAVVVEVAVPDLMLPGRRPTEHAADVVVPPRRLALRGQPFGIREPL